MLFLAPIPLQMFVGIFNHDDGSVDHCSDGNGNSTQTHDVGIDSLKVHDDKGHQDRYRQGQDGDQRTGQVEQEQCSHYRNNDTLFDQLFGQIVNRPFDQATAIVDGFDLDPLRQTDL